MVMQVPILVAVTAKVQLLITNSILETMTNTSLFRKFSELAKRSHKNLTNYLNNQNKHHQLS